MNGDSMFDFHELCIIFTRSIVSILVLYLVTRMLGKKQIGQLTFFDYIVGITIGSIAADAIVSLDTQFINGMSAIVWYGLVALLLSILSIKSFHAQKLLNGAPLMLIEDGVFLMDHFAKAKLPIFKFIEQCRILNCYDISEIRYAILETNGKLSLLLKDPYQMQNRGDSATDFYYSVIVDDCILVHNLERIGKSEAWLTKELKKQNIHSDDHIAVAMVSKKGKLHVFKAE